MIIKNFTSRDLKYSWSTAQLFGCPDPSQIYLGAIQATFVLPESDMSNCFLIHQYSIQFIYMQIFNKNPRFILSLIDHKFESAVNLWLACSYADLQQKSTIDLVTHRFSIWICGQPAHTQNLNKNPQLILSLIDLQLKSAINLFTCRSSTKSAIDFFTHRSSIRISSQPVHTQILNKNPQVICLLIICQETIIVTDHFQISETYYINIVINKLVI